eukprot:gnl/TRDRNA2_/TRDRNA2_181157_c0_seq1.p1 gnl/TRDRNA2_/TRDRNA2_181157_c0~~gnl/TRDRNA2_/TRDRNA2_181157_c0_seq1.p1  ORF type:complete len:387 (-),score=84.29 gnl/TRDRNA2_/TRDRNA2_181157_c0_seq1:26-1186(-)
MGTSTLLVLLSVANSVEVARGASCRADATPELEGADEAALLQVNVRTRPAASILAVRHERKEGSTREALQLNSTNTLTDASASSELLELSSNLSLSSAERRQVAEMFPLMKLAVANSLRGGTTPPATFAGSEGSGISEMPKAFAKLVMHRLRWGVQDPRVQQMWQWCRRKMAKQMATQIRDNVFADHPAIGAAVTSLIGLPPDDEMKKDTYNDVYDMTTKAKSAFTSSSRPLLASGASLAASAAPVILSGGAKLAASAANKAVSGVVDAALMAITATISKDDDSAASGSTRRKAGRGHARVRGRAAPKREEAAEQEEAGLDEADVPTSSVDASEADEPDKTSLLQADDNEVPWRRAGKMKKKKATRKGRATKAKRRHVSEYVEHDI